jgi:hypothetical protein
LAESSLNSYAYTGGNPFSYIDPQGLAWTYSFGVNLTVITSSTGFSVNLSGGFTVDGWNSRGFNQAQLNTADDGKSNGFYVGFGPTAGFATGAPTPGVSHTPYTEADAPIVGTSATKDDCGNIDFGVSKAIKLAPAVGFGGFSGMSHSATLVGPSLGTMFGH